MNKTFIIIIIIVIILIAVISFAGTKPEDKSGVQSGDTTSQKIDINAICEGSLAYMTFTDGASADQFVAECKEGKHPQVIEDWKKNQGINDDRAI